MVRHAAVFFAFLLLTAFSSRAALAHPDHVEKEILFHFAAGTHEIQNGTWQDLTHHATAQVIGAPRFRNFGPTEALAFDGNEYLSLAGNLADARSCCPCSR